MSEGNVYCPAVSGRAVRSWTRTAKTRPYRARRARHHQLAFGRGRLERTSTSPAETTSALSRCKSPYPGADAEKIGFVFDTRLGKRGRGGAPEAFEGHLTLPRRGAGPPSPPQAGGEGLTPATRSRLTYSPD